MGSKNMNAFFTALQKLPKVHASRLEYPLKLILTSIKRTFEKKY